MAYEEIMERPIGEMIDLVNLMSVWNGSAKEKVHMSFDEILRLR